MRSGARCGAFIFSAACYWAAERVTIVTCPNPAHFWVSGLPTGSGNSTSARFSTDLRELTQSVRFIGLAKFCRQLVFYVNKIVTCSFSRSSPYIATELQTENKNNWPRENYKCNLSILFQVHDSSYIGIGIVVHSVNRKQNNDLTR